jgi:chitosanase
MSDQTKLTNAHAELILQILQAIETGRPDGDYGLVSLMHDGGGDRLQLTLGVQFDEKSGDLEKVLELYCDRGGDAAERLEPFIGKINKFANHSATVLALDQNFQAVLRSLGKDPIMQDVQDEIFSAETWAPAKHWADANGFGLPLSMLVIDDSFLQSGGILQFLRERFEEVPPARGGEEKAWIRAYTQARHNWLSTSSNLAMRNSAYRTRFYLSLLELDDWMLEAERYAVNGVTLKGIAAA